MNNIKVNIVQLFKKGVPESFKAGAHPTTKKRWLIFKKLCGRIGDTTQT